MLRQWPREQCLVWCGYVWDTRCMGRHSLGDWDCRALAASPTRNCTEVLIVITTCTKHDIWDRGEHFHAWRSEIFGCSGWREVGRFSIWNGELVAGSGGVCKCADSRRAGGHFGLELDLPWLEGYLHRGSAHASMSRTSQMSTLSYCCFGVSVKIADTVRCQNLSLHI